MAINLNEIGARIRYYRKKRDISQSQLAELAHIGVPSMSLIENGKRCIQIDTFTLIVNALHVSADELLVGNLEAPIQAFNREFAALLADCSEYETRVLLDLAITAKSSLRKYKSFLYHPFDNSNT